MPTGCRASSRVAHSFGTSCAALAFCSRICGSPPGGALAPVAMEIRRDSRRPALVWDAPVDPVEVVGEKRMTTELSSLMVNLSRPVHRDTLTAVSSFTHSG
ncbi:unnamed protein product [Pleuronectes platessa]|uniref:Uncharacterized protein n=1 Tax=Pleuronectes platessa TaxID=8262 RepID=A0A9N7Y5H5_PLEPL|nr:unnamed protein product [Pleuronectes platessa]